MDWTELLEGVLVIAFRFLIVWFFQLINFDVDPAFVDALVAAIVAWLLAQFVRRQFARAGVRGIRG